MVGSKGGLAIHVLKCEVFRDWSINIRIFDRNEFVAIFETFHCFC